MCRTDGCASRPDTRPRRLGLLGGADRCESDPGGASPGAGVDCPTEKPAPISPDLASDALHKHGFGVVFDEGACGFGAIAGMLSNTSSGVTPLEVMDREGTVVCFLLVRPRNDQAVPESTAIPARHTPSAS